MDSIFSPGFVLRIVQEIFRCYGNLSRAPNRVKWDFLRFSSDIIGLGQKKERGGYREASSSWIKEKHKKIQVKSVSISLFGDTT